MSATNTSAIGLFDSGVGGFSIWKEVQETLPNESLIYIADSLHAPYGTKSKSDIITRCKIHSEYLIKNGCKLIIVACNTATTNAIDYLRRRYPIPFIGIEPAIKPASLHTRTGIVGVLATKGTLVSKLFAKTSQSHASDIQVITQQGDGLVELIETGKIDSEEMRLLITKYMQPMIQKQIDHLVLGCTHYPLLLPILKEILPKDVKIIDSGNAVAQQTKRILTTTRISNNKVTQPYYKFLSYGDSTTLRRLLTNYQIPIEIDECS